jgi:hypothetical protein
MASSPFRSLATSSAVLLGLLGGQLSALGGPAPRPKLFGGKVLEVHPDQHWFLMNGGASKKYPRIRIVHDRKTRWTGVPLRGRALRLGEPVQVTALPAGDAFRAVNVLVLDPHAEPGGSPSKAAPPR